MFYEKCIFDEYKSIKEIHFLNSDYLSLCIPSVDKFCQHILVIKSGKNKLPLHKMIRENVSICNSF